MTINWTFDPDENTPVTLPFRKQTVRDWLTQLAEGLQQIRQALAGLSTPVTTRLPEGQNHDWFIADALARTKLARLASAIGAVQKGGTCPRADGDDEVEALRQYRRELGIPDRPASEAEIVAAITAASPEPQVMIFLLSAIVALETTGKSYHDILDISELLGGREPLYLTDHSNYSVAIGEDMMPAHLLRRLDIADPYELQGRRVIVLGPPIGPARQDATRWPWWAASTVSETTRQWRQKQEQQQKDKPSLDTLLARLQQLEAAQTKQPTLTAS